MCSVTVLRYRRRCIVFATFRKLSMRMLVTILLIAGFAGESLGLNLGGTPWFWALLLGTGLFASTFGIDLAAMRSSDWRVVALAVTIGVFAKTAIISLSLFGVSLIVTGGLLIFFVLGPTMAQMDPLAVSALAKNRRMSDRMDNLVRAVSSLDDPVTVLMTILLVLSQKVFGFDLGATISGSGVGDMPGYGRYLWLNIAFMTSMVWFWQLAYKGSVRWKYIFTLALIACSLVIGASWYWMFGLALMGLYLRPEKHIHARVNAALETVTKIAFGVSGIVAGSLLYGVYGGKHFVADTVWGLALGAVAYASQMVVGWAMTIRGGYSRQDRLYFMCSHQNGMTATMLGVSTGTIAYVIPGIIMTHVLHAICMAVLNRRYEPLAEN